MNNFDLLEEFNHVSGRILLFNETSRVGAHGEEFWEERRGETILMHTIWNENG